MPRPALGAALAGLAAVPLLCLPQAALAQSAPCLQPRGYVQDLAARDGVDTITRNKVENLVEEARQLCARGEDRDAQVKFRHATALLEAALRDE